MAANEVNLDALIQREDFEARSRGGPTTSIASISLQALEKGSFLAQSLRKPDFQRETTNWTPRRVLDLIETFLSGDLVPAVILWQSGGHVFVIDGAHRLSALMGWVADDYGDGTASQAFFGTQIPDEQLEVAEEARDLIAKTVGTYQQHKDAAQKSGRGIDKAMRDRARTMGVLALPVQWVTSTSSEKAEAAFFKINQSMTEIDPAELVLLKSRRSANAVASRAIARGGAGHQYWSGFREAGKIKEIGSLIHSALYEPQLEQPIRTLDLPVAGVAYSGQTLPLAFDLVNLANDQRPPDRESDPFPADSVGTETLAFLKKTQALVARITGTTPASLGLQPALYCYTMTGNFSPAAFLGVCAFLKGLDEAGKLTEFSHVRGAFEDFVLARKKSFTDLTHKYGSGFRTANAIKSNYDRLLTLLSEGNSSDKIATAMKVPRDSEVDTAKNGKEGKSFSRGTKSAAHLRDSFKAALRCPICGGFLHKNSVHTDHKDRKRSGGSATTDNAQSAHPYCNSVVKR